MSGPRDAWMRSGRVPGVALLSRSGAPAEEVAFLTPVMTGAEVLERLGALEPQSLFRVLD